MLTTRAQGGGNRCFWQGRFAEWVELACVPQRPAAAAVMSPHAQPRSRDCCRVHLNWCFRYPSQSKPLVDVLGRLKASGRVCSCMGGIQPGIAKALLLLLLAFAVHAYIQCPPQWTAGYTRCYRLTDSVVTSAAALDTLCDNTLTGARVAVVSNPLDYPAAATTLQVAGVSAYVGASSIGRGTSIWADGIGIPGGIQNTNLVALGASNAAWGTGSMIREPRLLRLHHPCSPRFLVAASSARVACLNPASALLLLRSPLS